ncbi:MAG: hypothetical protein JAZ17_22030 [Candidatus Thiodiazotropha endolucinida]|nr:hypothetical protein [Candidatus Thiodiazotropha taylori]MCG8096267.1 hypothetical protein [Candidatus Thiodiazotropha endolucinida]MCW4315071.1 hypothetical protein [Candidatus Thiodiazotropha taylori]
MKDSAHEINNNNSTLLDVIKCDLYRLGEKKGIKEFIKQLLLNRSYRVVVTYRLCHALRSKSFLGSNVLFYICYFFHRLFTGSISTEIPINTKIGPGLLILHGYNIVINKQAVIGSNVTIFHQVTIGATKTGVPVIKDRVVLGVGSIIIGSITINEDVTVGAGSVVTKSIDKNTIVAGNPAKVIQKNAPGRAKNILR